ncbi:hypothetical protein EBU94_03030 [bacterium]|nr:hypothetical protein [bacterium]NBO36360.1 hypothetical protein [bacterium]
MSTLLEANLRRIEPAVGGTVRSADVSLNTNSIKITENVKNFFEEKAKRFRKFSEMAEDKIKDQLLKLIVSRLKFYFTYGETHPEMTISDTRKGSDGGKLNIEVENVKVDFFKDNLLFACIIKNKEDGNKWLVYFNLNTTTGKAGMDPVYVSLETSFFDLDQFPMETIVDAPQIAKGKAIEMTKKQFEDTIKSKRVGRITSKL